VADHKTKQFFGTAQTVFNYSSADITAGNFSPAGTDFDNTTDAAVPYADRAVATLACDFAVAPTAGQSVELWALPLNVDGTADTTDAPSGANSNGAVFLGAWSVDDTTSLQRRWTVISLEGLTAFTPYVKNATGQTMDVTASDSALVVKIQPFAVGVTV